MAQQQQKTIVGVFAMAGIVILGVLVVMFGGGRSLLTKTYDINVRFKQGVVGVQEGQSVTLNGKRIGTTKAVEFFDPSNPALGVKVVVAVEEQYDIPANSHVTVSTSLMGIGRPSIRIVVEDLAEADRLAHNGSAEIEGEMLAMLDQVFSPEIQDSLIGTARNLSRLLESLQPVVRNLEDLVEPRKPEEVDLMGATANVATVIARLDTALKAFYEIAGDPENQKNLKDMLASGRVMSERGAVVMEDLQAMSADGRKAMEKVGGLVERLTETMDRTASVLQHIDRTLAALDGKQGTFGSMLNDNRLYEELLLSARRLTKALDEARELMDVIKRGDLKVKLNP